MVFKKVKKGANTLTSLVLSLLVVIGIFTGLYLYIDWNATNSGVSLDSKYSQTYGNLTSSRNSLETNVNAIKDNLEDIKEADSVWQVAWNGLKGIGNTLKLPIIFINSALAVFTSLEYSLDFIPPWVSVLIVIGITAVIVFLILANLKGEGGKL